MNLKSLAGLNEEKFIEEGFWVILKVWSLLKDEIEERRKRDSSHHMEHLEHLRTKACEYAKDHDPKAYKEFCLDKARITEDTTRKTPVKSNVGP